MEGSGLAARVEAASDWFKLKWIGPILMVASLVGFTIMAWGLHQNQTFDAEHATTVPSVPTSRRTSCAGSRSWSTPTPAARATG